MTKNVKSEIQNTGFADILCDEAIHRDDNHMPSREELHRCYGGYLSESDFTTARGRNQNKSRIAEKIVADWAVDRQCEKNMQAMERKIKVME